MKKFLSLCLCLLMTASLLAACGGNGGSEQSAEAAYQVTVVDALGNPYTKDIAVKFMKDDRQVAMQIVNEFGVAEKTLVRDSYTVQLQFTDANAAYCYDTADLTLTKEKTQLTVVLSKALGEKSMNLFAGGADHTAYYVTPGCTQVELSADGRSYFIFDPVVSGKYEFSLTGSDVALGYYGESFFVQDSCVIETKDNTFQLSFSEDMLGGTPVIGIDAGEGSAILCIARVAEADWSIEMEEWTVYEPTVALSPYTLPAGAVLNKFDITQSSDAYELVFNESDGFYHLNSADGALVVVLIANGQEAPEYLDTFEQILENYALRRIFYDENGVFIRKEGYAQCLKQYIENSDETYGVYPLTEDLKYIIEQAGIQQGWFETSSPSYLFCDSDGVNIPGINNEISWLFMCRYLG